MTQFRRGSFSPRMSGHRACGVTDTKSAAAPRQPGRPTGRRGRRSRCSGCARRPRRPSGPGARKALLHLVGERIRIPEARAARQSVHRRQTQQGPSRSFQKFSSVHICCSFGSGPERRPHPESVIDGSCSFVRVCPPLEEFVLPVHTGPYRRTPSGVFRVPGGGSWRMSA